VVPKIASRIIVGVIVLVVALAGGTVFASARGLLSDTPSASFDPTQFVLPPPETRSPVPGLPPASTALTVDPAALQQALDALGQTGVGTISYCVQDMSGVTVAAQNPDAIRLPASSWKLMTSLAVLTKLGSDHRFTTKVVSSTAGVVIVGGGDPYLTAGTTWAPDQATVQALADQVAQALKAANRTSIVLGYDDSLFAGVQWNPAWPPEWAADVAPISALSIDPKGDATANSSQDAAIIFRQQLADRGITVTALRREVAAAGAAQLGAVQSLPLGRIVQRTLEISDNFAAEVLFRHLSADVDGSITASQVVLTGYLQAHGLWTAGMSVSDGSGLSHSDKVPASLLAAAVRTAYGDPALTDVLAGLPVAGVDGTLANRFNDPPEVDGRGVVRAKTGTDDNIRTLTGFVQTESGGLLVFSFMANDVTDHAATLNWLDEAAARLAAA